MSAEIESKSDTPSSCASCGVAEGDAVKLKNCSDACHLVRYCSVECQRKHRSTHKRACKKRAAELRDEILFRQPEGSHLGDCPICCLPLSLDTTKSTIKGCCSKIICWGCSYAYQKRDVEQNMYPRCPFCRQPCADSQAEVDKQQKDRAEMNDPAALREVGAMHRENGDYKSTFECYSKAITLDDVAAHYGLALLYFHGLGVEKDESKAIGLYEKAAIGGHPVARHNLGTIEWKNGRRERAVKHFIIAAKLGLDESLKSLKTCYNMGRVSKDDFAAALREHQAAVDATKSSQREEAGDFLMSQTWWLRSALT